MTILNFIMAIRVLAELPAALEQHNRDQRDSRRFQRWISPDPVAA
jgi:hypothetical protein